MFATSLLGTIVDRCWRRCSFTKLDTGKSSPFLQFLLLSFTIAIERIHLQFCKHLLGAKIQTQNNFIYGELGRVPVRNHRLVSAIRYWFKIVQSDDVKYIKLVYNVMLEDLQRLPEKLSWAKSVEILLESLEFGHVWLMQGVGDVTMF